MVTNEELLKTELEFYPNNWDYNGIELSFETIGESDNEKVIKAQDSMDASNEATFTLISKAGAWVIDGINSK